jgi:hypothetical protein
MVKIQYNLILIKRPSLILLVLVFLMYGFHMFNDEQFKYGVYYSTINTSIIYTFFFFLFFFTGLGKLNEISINTTVKFNSKFIYSFLLSIFLWIIYVLPIVISSTSRFENMNFMVRLLSFSLLMHSIFFILYDKSILSYISLILFSMHPLVTYSRSATVAIGIVAFLSFLKGKYFRFLILSVLTLFIYLLVVGFRHHAGYKYLVLDSIELFSLFTFETLKVIPETITPYFSIDIFFIHVFDDISLINISNILIFFIYLLPFPGSWLSKELYIGQSSLSSYIGIDENTFGLNSGLIPETFLWLGIFSFPFIYFLGIIIKKFLNSNLSSTIRLVLYLSVLMFFAFSTIMPIRGASRFLIYTIFYIYARKNFNRIIFR